MELRSNWVWAGTAGTMWLRKEEVRTLYGSPRPSSRCFRHCVARFLDDFSLFLRVLLLPLRAGGSEVEAEVDVGRGVGDADREEVGEGQGVPSGERGP